MIPRIQRGLALVFVCLATQPYGFVPGDKTPAQRLLQARVILVGRVKALTPQGKHPLRPGSRTTVRLFRAEVAVQQVVQGNGIGGTVFVVGIPLAEDGVTYIERQFLAVDRTYVFFLNPLTTVREYTGVTGVEFALLAVPLPRADLTSEPSLGKRLKAIARLNAEKADDRPAARWLEFLGDLYSADEDPTFLMTYTRDPRPRVRGSAILLLCRHSPGTPGLLLLAASFLEEAAHVPGVGTWRREISDRLFSLLGASEVPRHFLVGWLRSGARDLQVGTLDRLRAERDASFIREIDELLARTKDIRVQYACIKALAGILGVRGPGYDEFHEDPVQVVRAWRGEVVQAIKNPARPVP